MEKELSEKVNKVILKQKAEETPSNGEEFQEMLQEYVRTIHKSLVVEVKSKSGGVEGYTKEKTITVCVKDLVFATLKVRFTDNGEEFFTTPSLFECKQAIKKQIAETTSKLNQTD